MHESEREPQVIHEAEDHVVVRNHPFERSAETARGNGPRGVQPNGTVWPFPRGHTLGWGVALRFPRGHTLGQGVAFLPSFLRLGPPVVGTPTPISVASNVEEEMPALEPVICSSCWGAERRNWG